MCGPQLLGFLGLGGGAAAGAATAAGATAAAAAPWYTAAGAAAGATGAGLASTLQTLGLVASVAGPVVSGIQANQAAKANIEQLEEQRKTEAILNSIEDQRTREKFRHEIAAQRGAMVERGVSLGSPTAVYLGQTAAQEMAFASQSVRQTGLARDAELSSSQRAWRARGSQALWKGGTSAAGALLTGAPDVWPELLA